MIHVFSLFGIIFLKKRYIVENNVVKRIFKQNEYRVLYKRILFTCLILIIYILGSNISIVAQENTHQDVSSFYKLAVSNTGGDLSTFKYILARIRTVVNGNDYFYIIVLSRYGKSSKAD
ncbi:preprotein translocase subunit SecY [Staphylococcus gallinarum]|uniref:Preprotein translocase subunit SecY n=1 Tax=Staphylococcus gallinarum TaxID=1293 RepID=A0A380S9K0_STAGA|nr:preprotein translocase subunit SecY [Staphylococcus gallinarum]